MGLVIGMDEAGYGPNLGPLVITVTAWEVPGAPHEFDFWSRLSTGVAQPGTRNSDPDRILIGDSKQVYSPARGLRDLETSVLTLLDSASIRPGSFRELYQILARPCFEIAEFEPWFQTDLALPLVPSVEANFLAKWETACRDSGLILRGIASDVVLTERFNAAVSEYGSKGLALSRMSLALLRELWDPDEDDTVLIVADKHGGRNRYDDLLAEVLDDRFIFRLEEGTQRSRYRIGRAEVCFQTRAESHFPVAVASMLSKYQRELAMDCFNRFWQSHLPDLKPTKGYPTDARRFKNDIAEVQKRLGIPDATLWRNR